MRPILIAEDERPIADLIELTLTGAGYTCEQANDGEKAADLIAEHDYELAVLDIMLPGIDGYELLRYLRSTGTPVIFVTAKTSLQDRVRGLNLGADDYLTKPFDNRELLARIKAHLRRATKAPAAKKTDAVIKNGPLSIMPDERTVLLDGKEVHLTPKEFDLLYLLASNLEQVFPRDTLLEKIWGYDYYGDTRTVDMHVQRIRRKIDTQPNKFIQTVFGIGYKMRKI